MTAVAIAGVAYSVAAIRAASCAGLCRVNRGLAGLIMLAAVPATIGAVVWAWSTWRRGVSPTADGDGWRFGLAVIFALGIAAGVSRIPDLTCPSGYVLGGELCAKVGVAARVDATRWIVAKDAITIVGIVVGVTVIAARGLVRFTWPVAALAWLAGTSILLAGTLLHLY
jgi:hypothetical protein